MGPERGTERYTRQVETVATFFREAENENDVKGIMLAFILDTEYSRAAILEADHIVRMEKKKNANTQTSGQSI